jgi:hypothetical protein
MKRQGAPDIAYSAWSISGFLAICVVAWFTTIRISLSAARPRLNIDTIIEDLANWHMSKWTALNEEVLQPTISSEMLDEMEAKFQACHVRVRLSQRRIFYRRIGTTKRWWYDLRVENVLGLVKGAFDDPLWQVGNMDFFFSYCDHPRSADSTIAGTAAGYPLFAMHTSDTFLDIAFPDPLDLAPRYFPQGHSATKFSDKKDAAVFRGGTTNFDLAKGNWWFAPRLKLSRLSAKYPDLLDAGVTGFSHAEKVGNMTDLLASMGISRAQTLTHDEQLQHKYIIDLDGGLGSNRACSILMSSSLLLQVKSPFYQYFMPAFLAGVHYVEVQPNMEDLISTIKDLNSRPKDVQAMIGRANRLASVLCPIEGRLRYMKVFLKKYQRLMDKPELLSVHNLIPLTLATNNITLAQWEEFK